MIRLFLVDDHPILRQGLRAMLAAEPQLTIVGEAENGQELLAQLPAIAADVVLLDLQMPVLDGLATTQLLRQQYPSLRIVVLSMVAQAHSIKELFDAGAHGYLLKTADKRELVAAIRLVINGRQFLCSQVGLSLLEAVLAQKATELPAAKQGVDLTTREQEVLVLLSNGLTTQEISAELFTSLRTIETHRQHLLEKTSTRNTPALIKYGMDYGLLGE